MKDILANLALINLNSFCKEYAIDCSGTYLYKYPRKFTYCLKKTDADELVLTVTFHKGQTPTHTINPKYR